MTSISDQDVEVCFKRCNLEFVKMGAKTMVCLAALPNGFEVVVSSACVDPDNFSEEMGKSICRDKLKSHLWALLGYGLQQRLFEDRPEAPEEP